MATTATRADAAAPAERVKGYLVVSVCEASGKNKDDIVVWDPTFVEGFVKGALCGGRDEEEGERCGPGRCGRWSGKCSRLPVGSAGPDPSPPQLGVLARTGAKGAARLAWVTA